MSNTNQTIKNRFSVRITFFLLLPFFMGFFVHQSQAQESTQIIISGVPPVLSSPFYEDLLDDYDRGLYQLQFIYTAQGTVARSFRFSVTVTRDGRQLANVTSDPVSFEPGVYFLDDFFRDTNFPTSVSEILDNFTSEFRNQLIQTGALPEGSYSIRFEARPVQEQPFVTVIPGFVNAAVRLPQPPILVTPPNEANVLIPVPVFTWTPVVAIGGLVVEYEFLMVELLDGQNPEDALVSNPPHLEQTVLQNTLPYTPDLFPLETGRKYAWQIIARDAAGQIPFSGNGRSEVYTFTFGQEQTDDELPAGIEAPIALVPGLLQLTEIELLDSFNDGVNLVLNGNATAELSMAGAGTTEIPVFVSNLRIAGAGSGIPIILGGNVELDEFEVNAFLENRLPSNTLLTNIQWSLATGLRSRLLLDLPGLGMNEADGFITLTSGGLAGMAQLSGSPLLFAEDDYLQLNLNTVSVNAASGMMSATGSVNVMGRDSGCIMSNLLINGDNLTGNFSCQESFNIPLVNNSPYLAFEITRMLGSAGMNMSTGDLVYDVTMPARLGLLTTNGNYCGSGFSLSLQHETGISSQQSGGYFCPEAQATIGLGFADLVLNQTNVEELTYNPATDEWDFLMNITAMFRVRAFDNWLSSSVSGITINRDGINFPAIDFHHMTAPMPDFNADRLRARLSFFSINESVFPLFAWDGIAPGPWDMSYSGRAIVRNASGVPACLIGREIDILTSQMQQGQIVSPLRVTSLQNCNQEISESLLATYNGVSGQIALQYSLDGMFQTVGNLNLAGFFTLGEPFTCTGSQQISFDSETISLAAGLKGDIEGIASNCSFELGEHTADISNATLILDLEPQQPNIAILMGAATLNLGAGNSTNGSFEFDFMQNAFRSLDFNVQNEFTLSLPSDPNPIVSFRIGNLEVGANVMVINGRHNRVFAGSQDGVTFDNVIFNIQQNSIDSGRIILDNPFTIQGTYTEGSEENDLRTVTDNELLTVNPGFQFRFGDEVQIDSTGLRTTGTGPASILYFGNDMRGRVSAHFSSDFRFDVQNKRVTQGWISFIDNETELSVAVLDQSGFAPTPMLSAGHLIPEILPLSDNESVGYIRLRDEDTYYVTVDTLSNGNIQLNALPGGAVLRLTYFDGNNPLELTDLTFNNFVVTRSPESVEIIGGSIRAGVDGLGANADLRSYDLPLHLREIIFDKRTVSGVTQHTVSLLGDLYLYNQRVAGDEPVTLSIDRNQNIVASFNDAPVFGNLSLVDERIHLSIETITGNFLKRRNVPIGFSLLLNGEIQIGTDTGWQPGARVQVVSRQNNIIQLRPGFQLLDFDENQSITIGDLSLSLSGVNSISGLSYTTQTGFQILLGLNAQLSFAPAGGDPFVFPMLNVRMERDGIRMGSQAINQTTIPGFSLAYQTIAGYELRPVQLEIKQPFVLGWNHTGDIPEDAEVLIDLEMQLPEFLTSSGLNAPDGLFVGNAQFNNGIFSGVADVFEPLNGALIPLHDSSDQTTIRVQRVGSTLATSEDGVQQISMNLEGNIDQIAGFIADSGESCPTGAPFTLSVNAEVTHLEGSIENVQACGFLRIGHLLFQATNGIISLSGDEDGVAATLSADTAVLLNLPDSEREQIANGAFSYNILSGALQSGSAEISGMFRIPYPALGSEPFLELELSEGQISTESITINGQGRLITADYETALTYDALQLRNTDFSITAGSAESAGAFKIHRELSPARFSILPESVSTPENNILSMKFEGGMRISEAGLHPRSLTEAIIIFEERDYPNLTSVLSDDFNLRLSGSAVRGGSILFYEEGDTPGVNDALSTLNTSGFMINEDPNRTLPVQIMLPSQQIAYLTVRNEAMEALVLAETTDDGVRFRTTNQPVTLTLPSLTDNGQPLQVQVEFDLLSDITFNVFGGTITLLESVNAASYLGGLPATIIDFDLNSENELQLMAGVLPTLPQVFSEFDEPLFIPLTSAGFTQGVFSNGEMSPTGNSAVLIDKTAAMLAAAGNTIGSFTTALHGVQLEIGSETSSKLSGSVTSTYFELSGDRTLTYTAQRSGQDWEFEHNALGDSNVLFGETSLDPDGENPIRFVSNQNHFHLIFAGILSFEEVFGEKLDFTAENIIAGISDLQTSPRAVLSTAQSGNVQTQIVELFGNAVQLHLNNPVLNVNRDMIELAADGFFSYASLQLPFTGFSLRTDGALALPSYAENEGQNASSDSKEMIPGQVSLVAAQLVKDEETGLSFDVSFAVIPPDPFHEMGEPLTMTQRIHSNEESLVVVNNDNMSFEFESGDRTVEMGDFGIAGLENIRFIYDPFESEQRQIQANMAISVILDPLESLVHEYEPTIFLGNFSQPGITITYSPEDEFPRRVYRVTSNEETIVPLPFYTVRVAENTIVSPSNEPTLRFFMHGSAEFNIPGIEGEFNVNNITVISTGIQTKGILVNTTTINMAGALNANISSIRHISNEDGFNLTLTDTQTQTTEQLGQQFTDSGLAQKPTIQVSGVTEILCFGICPELPGISNSVGFQAPRVTLNLPTNVGSADAVVVDYIFMYKQSDGQRFLSIKNFKMKVDDGYEFNLDLNYVGTQSQHLFTGLGQGTASKRPAYASAVIGKRNATATNAGYSLMTATRPGSVVPITPVFGITDLAATILHNPTQDDVNMVIAAMSSIDYEPVVPGFLAGLNMNSDVNVIKFGGIGIGISFTAISGGDPTENYILHGRGFVNSTANGRYFDARVDILRRISLGHPQAYARGSIVAASARVENARSMLFSMSAEVRIPLLVEATGLIEFFFADRTNGNSWGIIGMVNLSLFEGLLESGGDSNLIVISNDGFLFQFSVGKDRTFLGVFSLRGSIVGSLWVLNPSEFSIPRGAFAVFTASTRFYVFTALVQASGALVTTSSASTQLFCSVRACIGIDVVFHTIEVCGSAWVKFSGDGARGGLGSAGNNDLIAKARQQRDDLIGNIRKIQNELTSVKQSIEEASAEAENNRIFERMQALTPSDELIKRAGSNLYMKPIDERTQWADEMLAVEEINSGAVHEGFTFVANSIMKSSPANQQNMQLLLNNMTQRMQESNDILDSFSEFDDTILRALELLENSEEVYEQLATSFAVNPVTNISMPIPSTDPTASTSFNVDMSRASNQISALDDLDEELRQLDARFRNNIQSVETNLSELRRLMIDDSGTPLMSLVTPFKDLIESMETYFAKNANNVWDRVAWARNIRNQLIANEASVNAGINSLFNHYSNNFETVTSNNPSLNITPPFGGVSPRTRARRNLAWSAFKLAQRDYTLQMLSGNLSFPGSGSDFYWGGIGLQAGTSSIAIHPENNFKLNRSREIYQLYSVTNGPGINDRQSSFNAHNRALWYEMHLEGLHFYERNQIALLDDILDQRNTLLGEVLPSFAELTQQFETFYTIQATLTSILWNMNETYIDWRNNLDNADDLLSNPEPVQTYVNRNMDLSNELIPPQISGLGFVQNNFPNTFYRPIEINWQFSHPVEITEVAIQYEMNTASEADGILTNLDSYISLGKPTSNSGSITLKPFLTADNIDGTSFDAVNPSVDFGLRVRGAAGNTAIRRGVVQAVFSPNLIAGELAFTPTPNNPITIPGDLNPENPQPPNAPVLFVPDVHFGTYPYQGQDAFWTSNPGFMEFVINGYDAVFGIATYEMAIGSAPGLTDVRDWFEVQGERRNLPEIPAQQMVAKISFLAMEEHVPYYMSARVINTNGLVSPAFNLQEAIIYDNVEPAKPVVVYAPSARPSNQVVHSGLTPFNPTMETPRHNCLDPDNVRTTLTFPAVLTFTDVSAVQEYSHIYSFEYFISRSADDQSTRFDSGGFRTTLYGEDFIFESDPEDPAFNNFTRPMYLHVRAVSNAKKRGDIAILGPFTPVDTTKPFAGNWGVHRHVWNHRVDPWRDSDLRLYMRGLPNSYPFDPEVGTRGMQYSISHRNTHTGQEQILKSFRTDGQADFTWTNQTFNERCAGGGWYGLSRTPFFTRILTSDLPQGYNDEITIWYRSVNNRGDVSDTYGVGPIRLVKPTINIHEASRQGNEIHVVLQANRGSSVNITSVQFNTETTYSTVQMPGSFDAIVYRSSSNQFTNTNVTNMLSLGNPNCTNQWGRRICDNQSTWGLEGTIITPVNNQWPVDLQLRLGRNSLFYHGKMKFRGVQGNPTSVTIHYTAHDGSQRSYTKTIQ